MESNNDETWHLWPLADVLTVETGQLICSMEELCEFLNWMTGDDLYTHQLPRATDVCRPFLEEKIGWLKDCVSIEIDKDNYQKVFELASKHGEYVMVPRLPEGAWEHKNPIAELAEMING